MKKIFLISFLILLFDGCSYKNKIYKDDFQKKVEINRENCTDRYAKYDAYTSDISLKEKCELTYNGFHTQIYDQYELNKLEYITGSILLPYPIGTYIFICALASFNKKFIKESFGLVTYPFSPLYYYGDKKKDFLSPYDLNPKKQHYQAEESLMFKDTVNIFPDKEIWIGDNKHKYPLQLNDDLSYHIPRDLVNYFCAQNYDDCNLTLYQRDDDTFTKFTTVNIKGNK
jgi:hypothetical protein